MVQSDTSTDLAAAASVNGVSAVGDAAAIPPHAADQIQHSGPRMPKRVAWVDLPEEYPGFRMLCWINFPKPLEAELQAGDMDRMYAAVAQIVTEHNGWLDFDGNPLPPASTRAFWESIPDELLNAITGTLRAEILSLGNSLAPRTRRR